MSRPRCLALLHFTPPNSLFYPSSSPSNTSEKALNFSPKNILSPHPISCIFHYEKRMGKEADPVHFDADNGEADGHGGVRFLEWEIGLPTADDLMPLSQRLVPPALASAFSIQPEPARTILDVHRASQATLSSLRHAGSVGGSCSAEDQKNPNQNSDPNSPEDQLARGLKRPRLVWTPQLHKRFAEVVAHLGIKNAVPKTIMQLMNVEGLTRENVASHLQKYRLYLKRMSGISNEGPSVSDPIFASTPVPENLMTSQLPPPPPRAKHVPAQMPYVIPTTIPVPMYGKRHGYDGNYRPQHLFGGYGEQRGKDWVSGSMFGHGSIASYPHRLTPNDK